MATTPSQTSPATLQGIAELTAALTHAAGTAGTGGTLVVIDGDLEGGEACTHLDTCSQAPQITLAADLLTAPYPLYGALAHEVAHRALGHLTGRRPWQWAAQVAGIAAVALALTGYPWALTAAAAAVMAAGHMVDTHRQRREELQADTYSAELLNAVGLPGRQIVATTLERLPADGWWYRTAGWIWGHHPTVTARRRAIARSA